MKTVIYEEIGSSNSIDELFNYIKQPNSGKELKHRKLPASFFQPNFCKSGINIYHSQNLPSQINNNTSQSFLKQSKINKNGVKRFTDEIISNNKPSAAKPFKYYSSSINLLTKTTPINSKCYSQLVFCDSTNQMPISYYNKNVTFMYKNVNNWNTTAISDSSHIQDIKDFAYRREADHPELYAQVQLGPVKTSAVAQFGPLPDGWEMAINESQRVYFVDHQRKCTQWLDPRLPDGMQHSYGYTLAELCELHLQYQAMLAMQEEERRLIEFAQQGDDLHSAELLMKSNHLNCEANSAQCLSQITTCQQNFDTVAFSSESLSSPATNNFPYSNLISMSLEVNNSTHNFIANTASTKVEEFHNSLQNHSVEWLSELSTPKYG